MKKSTKYFLVVLSIVALSALMLGCGSSETDSVGESSTNNNGVSENDSNSDNADTLTLQFAHVQPESHAFHQGAVKFGEVLEEVSGGQMKLDIYPNGQMGSERDLLEGLQVGNVDFITVTSALTSTFNENYAIFSLPFLFDDFDHLFQAVDDPAITDGLHQSLIDVGIRPIGYWVGGSRSYYGKEPVGTIEDLNNVQVRTMEDPYYIHTWESLGASPSAIPFNEVYSALETGLIDGAEGAINTYIDRNFYEVAPNVAFTNYVYSVQMLHMAESTWEDLNEKQREWVTQAAEASVDYERELILETEAGLENELEELDVNMTFPDIEPFREAVQPVYDEFEEEYGSETYSIIEQIISSRN